MNDFIEFTVNSYQPSQVLPACRSEFPDFIWKEGESESQGEYISGRNDQLIGIKIWLGEKPAFLTVSFRAAKIETSAIGEIRQAIVNRIERLIRVLEGSGLDTSGWQAA